jgi:hypothetical protein
LDRGGARVERGGGAQAEKPLSGNMAKRWAGEWTKIR